MKGMFWRIVGTGSAVLAGIAAQKSLTVVWKAATGTEPPTIPEDPDTEWKEAVAWALASGAVIGLARLFAARKAAGYYRRATGELPANLRREA